MWAHSAEGLLARGLKTVLRWRPVTFRLYRHRKMSVLILLLVAECGYISLYPSLVLQSRCTISGPSLVNDVWDTSFGSSLTRFSLTVFSLSTAKKILLAYVTVTSSECCEIELELWRDWLKILANLQCSCDARQSTDLFALFQSLSRLIATFLLVCLSTCVCVLSVEFKVFFRQFFVFGPPNINVLKMPVRQS